MRIGIVRCMHRCRCSVRNSPAADGFDQERNEPILESRRCWLQRVAAEVLRIGILAQHDPQCSRLRPQRPGLRDALRSAAPSFCVLPQEHASRNTRPASGARNSPACPAPAAFPHAAAAPGHSARLRRDKLSPRRRPCRPRAPPPASPTRSPTIHAVTPDRHPPKAHPAAAGAAATAVRTPSRASASCHRKVAPPAAG